MSSLPNKGRVLVVTQVVDSGDLYLGFFHRWLEELSSKLEHIEVICLKEGNHALASNVRVHTLGKEKVVATRGRRVRQVAYAWRFLKLAWELRDEYDAVLVHMNQEYVLISGWLWKLLGKRVYMWRNHYAGSWLTRVAGWLCDAVFYTSKHSFTARFANAVRMPVGVDTARFFPDASVARAPRSILFFARMMESKRPGLVIDALTLLVKEGVSFTASFVGSAPPGEDQYVAALKQRVADAGLADRITFSPGVPNERAAAIYRTHAVYVNAGRSGMLDKTLFEAAATGCFVVAASDDFRELAGGEHYFESTEQLAECLAQALTVDVPNTPFYIDDQSLSSLMDKLAGKLSS